MNYGTPDDWMLWKYKPLKCDNCDHSNAGWTTTNNAFNRFGIGKQHYNFLCNDCYQKLVVITNQKNFKTGQAVTCIYDSDARNLTTGQTYEILFIDSDSFLIENDVKDRIYYPASYFVPNTDEPARKPNLKFNYKLVACERTCNKICPYYETISHCVTGGCTLSNLIVADGWPCIPGLKEQRDDLELEVKLLNKILEGCPGCMATEQGVESLKEENGNLREENMRLQNEWETMYAGRECPNCGYHVTINGESDD